MRKVIGSNNMKLTINRCNISQYYKADTAVSKTKIYFPIATFHTTDINETSEKDRVKDISCYLEMLIVSFLGDERSKHRLLIFHPDQARHPTHLRDPSFLQPNLPDATLPTVRNQLRPSLTDPNDSTDWLLNHPAYMIYEESHQLMMIRTRVI